MRANYWVEDRFRVMGTTGHVILGDAPGGLLSWARDEFERLEQSWTRFSRYSELGRLNADPRSEVPISARLRQVIERALDAWRETDGWFDPTVLDALESAGYDRSFELIDGPVTHREAIGPTRGLDELELDDDVVRRPPGLHLDLGGIGKGLAIDLVTDGLTDRGARRVCLSVGGDVRVGGEAPSVGWSVPVQDPFDRDVTWFSQHFDGPGAIVTSSTHFRRWTTTNGTTAHHLIDPVTGAPSTSGITAAVVVADEAWWAESLAKAAVVAGPDIARELLGRHGVTAWLALDDGNVIETTAPTRSAQPA